MTTAKTEPATPKTPFLHEKIPVADGLTGFEGFADQYPGFVFCPYVADKDSDGWSHSTSRVYMNQVKLNADFLYVPVNIAKGDLGALRTFFESVQKRKDVPAVNLTQPHKSSPVLRELYFGDPDSEANVDTLIRNDEGKLEPYDLNSAAFVEWYKEDIGTFRGKPVVLVGVGGVGEPIAKKIAAEKPSSLSLVDVTDKSAFAARLGETAHVAATFEASLRGALDSGLAEGSVVINAAGKEGAADESELWQLIQRPVKDGIFVDVRPHLDIAIVEEAKRHGWDAYTGHGMNVWNDYELLRGIVNQILKQTPNATLPSLEAFASLVRDAS